MKKLLLILFALFIFGGCSTVSYRSPTGETLDYNRLGTQNLNDFKLVKDEKGITRISFSKQEGGENIGEIVKSVTEVAMTAMTKVP